MGYTITKLINGNVVIEQTGTDVVETVQGNKSISIACDQVIIQKSLRKGLTPENVDKLVRSDGTEIFPTTLRELHDELANNFFFLDPIDLLNSTYEVSYSELLDISSTTSGTISAPQGSTLDTTEIPGNALFSTVNGLGQILGESPLDGAGNAITANLDTNFNWVASNTYPTPVAIMFRIRILGKDYQNLDPNKVIDIRLDSAEALQQHAQDTNNPHQTGIANLLAGTLAQLNAKITDATLDDVSGARTPTAHANTHEIGGTDEIDGESLKVTFSPVNYTPSSASIQGHLDGIDDALPTSGGGSSFAEIWAVNTLINC